MNHTIRAHRDMARKKPAAPTIEAAPPKKFFNWQFDIGHVLVIVGGLVSGMIYYGADQADNARRDAHITSDSTRLDTLERADLPPRMASIEAQLKDFRETARSIDRHLANIDAKLDNKVDRRN